MAPEGLYVPFCNNADCPLLRMHSGLSALEEFRTQPRVTT